MKVKGEVGSPIPNCRSPIGKRAVSAGRGVSATMPCGPRYGVRGTPRGGGLSCVSRGRDAPPAAARPCLRDSTRRPCTASPIDVSTGKAQPCRSYTRLNLTTCQICTCVLACTAMGSGPRRLGPPKFRILPPGTGRNAHDIASTALTPMYWSRVPGPTNTIACVRRWSALVDFWGPAAPRANRGKVVPAPGIPRTSVDGCPRAGSGRPAEGCPLSQAVYEQSRLSRRDLSHLRCREVRGVERDVRR